MYTLQSKQTRQKTLNGNAVVVQELVWSCVGRVRDKINPKIRTLVTDVTEDSCVYCSLTPSVQTAKRKYKELLMVRSTTVILIAIAFKGQLIQIIPFKGMCKNVVLYQSEKKVFSKTDFNLSKSANRV